MSKSDESDKGAIFLSDDPEQAAKKIMSAETDSLGVINYDTEKQPGISNLLQILALFSSKTLKDVALQWQGKSSYGELKTAVAELTKEFLINYQSLLAKVDEDYLNKKLEEGETAMNAKANATLLKVQKAVGLRP